MTEKKNSERLAKLEVEMNFYREFLQDIKQSIDNLGKEIHGVSVEMRKEREQEMDILKNKIDRLKFWFWLAEYPRLSLLLVTIYTMMMIKESRDFLLSLFF